MSSKISLARFKKFGMTFEISIDPDAALKYKHGEGALSEVLLADGIFSDAKKGLLHSNDELMKVFQTTDTNEIVEVIIKQGEIQSTSEHRSEEREQKRKKLITMIHMQAIDAKTGLPHPATRIEAALEEGKIQLDYNKTIEEQFDDVIKKLRPIIPIKIEMVTLEVTISSQYSGKAYNVVSSNSQIMKDSWNPDGSWTVSVEVPAGFKPEFIEKLNALTHGEVVVKEG
jgi:ribosome maturation protein SDO1